MKLRIFFACVLFLFFSFSLRTAVSAANCGGNVTCITGFRQEPGHCTGGGNEECLTSFTCPGSNTCTNPAPTIAPVTQSVGCTDWYNNNRCIATPPIVSTCLAGYPLSGSCYNLDACISGNAACIGHNSGDPGTVGGVSGPPAGCTCQSTGGGACSCVTPQGTPNPGGGGSCSADCHPPAADCGVYGKDPASGTCSNGYLCCKPRTGDGALNMGAYAYCQDPGGPVYPLQNLPMHYISYKADEMWSNPQQEETLNTNFQGIANFHKQTYPAIGQRFINVAGYDSNSTNPLHNYTNLSLSTGQKFSNLQRGNANIVLNNCSNAIGGWVGVNGYRPPVNGKTYMCSPWYINDPSKDDTYVFQVPNSADNQVNAVWHFTSCQACVPNCALKCGQSDGCGGTCANTDNTTPLAPTGLNPINGASVTPNGSNQVTLSWSPTANTSYYEVQVYPTGTAAGQECTAANTHCANNNASTSYTFTVAGSVANYTWRVRAINAKCTVKTGPWTTQTFSIAGVLSGTVYLDTSETAVVNGATGLCQVGGSPATQDPGAGASIVAKWNSPQVTTTGSLAGANYTINNVGAYPNTIVSLTPNLTTFSCVCPAGCSYSGLSSPKSGINFYLTNIRPGWWQTSNGLVYAAAKVGTAVVDVIPTATCTAPSCTPSLSTRDSNKTPGSAGFSLSGGGSFEFAPSGQDVESGPNYFNEDGANYSISGTDLTGNRSSGPHEDYTYFSNLYNLGTAPVTDFTGAKPSAAPSNGSAYYAGGDVTISSAWAVGKADSYVIFVKGNLRITQPITVTPGGFVAFIVKGDIIFDKGLGQAAPTSSTASVAGVFISDKRIIVEANGSGVNDLKFVGEGTFVGWQGVDMKRKYVPQAPNATNPNEYFRYRPDFLINTPSSMLTPLAIWQETN